MADQEKDPVVHQSLSKPLFIWSAILVLSMAWGLYDELYGIRPWKRYEARFEKLYGRYVKDQMAPEAEIERAIKAQPEYQRLDREMRAEEQKVAPQVAKIKEEVDDLTPKIQALNDPFQEVRGHTGALNYEAEQAGPGSRQDSLRQQIEELKKEVHKIKLPGESQEREMNFDQMDKQLKEWKDRKAFLLQESANYTKPASELRAARDKYLSDRISGASDEVLAGVQTSLEKFDIKIRQIHIKDVDLVDRCE